MLQKFLLFLVTAHAILVTGSWVHFGKNLIWENITHFGPPMKALTAAYFIFCGLAAFAHQIRSKYENAVAKGYMGLVAIFCLLALGGKAHEGGLGSSIELSNVGPWFDYPALMTIVSFLIVSSAEFFKKYWLNVYRFAHSIVLTISAVAILGYIANLPALYYYNAAQSSVGMALTTALSFFFLSFCLISSKNAVQLEEQTAVVEPTDENNAT